MPVLIFTLIFSFIFILMTYARLDHFQNFMVVRSQFKKYTQLIEHDFTNLKAIDRYNRTTMSQLALTKDNSKIDADEAKAAKTRSSSKLSIYTILSAQQRGTEPARHQQTRAILERLIHQIYKDYPFYKESYKKNPEFVQDFITRIEVTSSQLHEQQRLDPDNKDKDKEKDKDDSDVPIKDLKDLNTLLNLDNNGPLDELLYKILKGAQDPNADEKARKVTAESLASTDPKSPEQDDDPMEEVEENGYDSILDYISLDKESKINLYLASRNLLMALFGRPETVEALIKQRTDYYRTVKKSSPEVESGDRATQLSQEFQRIYEPQLLPNIDSHTIEFKVTKTDPRKYE